MSVYVILDTLFDNSEPYEDYKAQVEPIVNKYGRRYPVRDGAHQAPERD